MIRSPYRSPVLRIAFLGMMLSAEAAHADVTLAPLFQNNAILQREKPVTIWGTADPGEAVSVTYTAPDSPVAAESQTATTTADSAGKWKVRLTPLKANSSPASLIVSGKNTIRREGILVGEVWLAAGQSNMDMALFWTPRGIQQAEAANFPLIRFVKIGTASSANPKDTVNVSWSDCVGGKAKGFSELAFHFAKQLHSGLGGVPIGIINSSWGGTSIEAWMNAEALANDPAGDAVKRRWEEALAAFPTKQEKFRQAKAAWTTEKEAAQAAGAEFKKTAPFPPSGGPGSQYVPSGLYNAMIHPLVPFTLRGVIWYQGENNVKRAAEYASLFPSLITGWRSLFEQGDMPFYWVQLPNYNIGDGEADWPALREAQSRTLSLPQTGQAVTIDIGDPKEIHPANKEEVARRLALIAFKRLYGKPSLIDSGPLFQSADFSADGKVTVHFKELANGLQTKPPGKPDALEGFTLSGTDGIHQKALAHLDPTTNSVSISSPAIPNPTEVRYAWTNNPMHLSLTNSEGLPAAPFRSRK